MPSCARTTAAREIRCDLLQLLECGKRELVVTGFLSFHSALMNTQEPAKIVSVTLTPEQALVLAPIIDAHRDITGVTGLLGAITRSYRERDGRVTLELQL